MTIRRKAFVLLLLTALIPLVAVAAMHRASMAALGRRLGAEARNTLTRTAVRAIHRVVEDYGEIVERDRRLVESALRLQAREVEKQLVEPAPVGVRVWSAEDFDRGVAPLEAGEERRLSRPRRRGEGDIAVSYAAPVIYVVKGVEWQGVAPDASRLAGLAGAWREIWRMAPETILWQYVSLAEGVHCSYPGHGGYPDDYDPRTRPWYKEAVTWEGPQWTAHHDVTTRLAALTASIAVKRPDGRVAGVTAIDVPLEVALAPLKLPPMWAKDVVAMLVCVGPAGTAFEGKLVVIMQKGAEAGSGDWRAPIELTTLRCDSAEDTEAVLADIQAGQSGTRIVRQGGRDMLWAYGRDLGGEYMPLVIVPCDVIAAQAQAIEDRVMEETHTALMRTGVMLAVAAVVVAALALRTARAVTQPVRQLARAAEALAAGRFDARVSIRSRDELQALGDAVNQIGPRLRERDRMKQSLALAHEVQQDLLPQTPPRLPGFDIAGGSVYCDETGGDYFDYIELLELGPSRMGIALADVSGHGVGAALLMASARGVLRTQAGLYGEDLSRVFNVLNRHLVRDTGPERFVTMFYGVLDAEKRELRWTSGGHDPALWLQRKDGGIKELDSDGIPLGVLEDFAYGQAGPVTLESGDMVVIGTDGIWEARSEQDELFGKPRFRDLLVRNRGRTAREVYDAVVSAVAAWRGAGPQTDDVTLVVIRAE